MLTKSDIAGMHKANELRRFRAGKAHIWIPPSSYAGRPSTSSLESLDDLLVKDKRREKDGFTPKIKFRNVLAGRGRVISVPYVEEEKLIHGEFEPKPDPEDSKDDQGEGSDDLGKVPGHGEGEVGDVIGEAPVQGEGEGEGEGENQPQPGQGEGGHGFEQEAYEIGRKLSEKFQLPNLKNKGKRVPTDEYIYDLTDRHPTSGQLLDKKETLKRIVRTNMILGRLDKDHIDTTKLVVGPDDKMYRVLSREKVWKSQAVVFFARDYSGSMLGEPTRIIVEQHFMIYSWLLVQYDRLVIPRFFVHDTEAREVSVLDYFGLMAGGGTLIPSVYKAINKTVDGENLARDYNIYVFQGTDGDDFDDGRQAIPEIEKILGYVNRMGVCVLRGPYFSEYGRGSKTAFEHYVDKGGFLDRKDVFRMHVMSSENVTEEQNVEAIKVLIAQD